MKKHHFPLVFLWFCYGLGEIEDVTYCSAWDFFGGKVLWNELLLSGGDPLIIEIDGTRVCGYSSWTSWGQALTQTWNVWLLTPSPLTRNMSCDSWCWGYTKYSAIQTSVRCRCSCCYLIEEHPFAPHGGFLEILQIMQFVRPCSEPFGGLGSSSIAGKTPPFFVAASQGSHNVRPPHVINWFITPINYSYIYHKP